MVILLPLRQVGLVTGLASLLFTGVTQGQSTLLDESPLSEPKGAPRVSALLDQVKKSELDRMIAVKQKEIERLQEDQARAERDASGLQATISSTNSLITGGEEAVRKLADDSRRLEHELKVAEAQMMTEKLKMDGLRALNVAQAKSLSALSRRGEEAEARARVNSIELELLQAGKPVSVAEHGEDLAQTDLGRARKALAAAELRAQVEERAAREAMKDVTLKMAQADAQAVKAQRLADNDLTMLPTPIAEKPKAKEKPAPERTTEKRETVSVERRAQPAPIASASTPSPALRKPKPPIFGR